METKLHQQIEKYFSRPDTPAIDSPVGIRMLGILKKHPTMSFDEARLQAGGTLPAVSDVSERVKQARSRLGWTQAEEDAFAQIMRVGHLDRLPAIRLYRRSGSFERALAVAKAEAPTEAELARHKAFGEMAKARAAMRSKIAHIRI